MELKSKTRQFGDVTVKVVEFDAWRGFQLLPRLGTVLGPLSPDDSGVMNMGMAIPALCSAVAADEGLLLALLGSTTCTVDDNEFLIKDKVHINLAFSGQLWSLAEVLGMVMEVSFTDFLSKALSAVESLGPAKAEKVTGSGSS